jgi:phosphonate transport system permease protein
MVRPVQTLTEDPATGKSPAGGVTSSPRPRRRTLAPPRPNTVAATLMVLALLGFGLWSLADLQINFATLADSLVQAQDFVGRMLPLDFPPVAETTLLILQTLAIVISATLLSMLLSIPLAFWAAGNTARNRTSRFGARGVIVAARAVPDVVLAIIFGNIFGLGVLPGVLAMGLHSIGMIGKLYSDAIEQIDEGPRTAIRATGAGRLQQLTSGVFPQVLPAFVATAMHRLDINLRISVLLGFVGVAGIGKDIKDAISRLDYPRAMALAAIVLALCIIMELISGGIRKAILGPAAEPTRGGPVWLAKRLSGASPARRPDSISAPWTSTRLRRTVYLALGGAAVLAAVLYVVMDAVGAAGARGLKVLGDLFPPNTGGIEFEVLLTSLFITVEMAFAATVIGAILAIPVGVLAARNVAPTSVVGKSFRIFIVTVRGIPELILAIVFVIMIGFGEVAATLALSVGAIGLLGKLVADSIEEVDPGVEQALRATGATRVQVFFAATLPQALPAFVGHALYQLDVNIRSAALVGIVGAGGIGLYLLEAARVREFGTVTLITLMLFAVVMSLELVAIWLRRTAGAKS